MTECPLLDRLPVELRLRIYECLLPNREKLKLRQHIPGTLDLAILRTNRQIYEEALSTLYDLNTIIVSRNDFCSRTDAGLKTPLKSQHARSLWFASFSQSIACTIAGLEGRCDVCEPSASGLLKALAAMPRLRRVTIDTNGNAAECYALGSAHRATRFEDTALGLSGVKVMVLTHSRDVVDFDRLVLDASR